MTISQKCNILPLPGGLIGTLAANLVAGVILQYVPNAGWQLVFYLFGVLSIIWFGYWYVLCFNDPQSHPYITSEEKSYLEQEMGSIERDKVQFLYFSAPSPNTFPSHLLFVFHVELEDTMEEYPHIKSRLGAYFRRYRSRLGRLHDYQRFPEVYERRIEIQPGRGKSSFSHFLIDWSLHIDILFAERHPFESLVHLHLRGIMDLERHLRLVTTSQDRLGCCRQKILRYNR